MTLAIPQEVIDEVNEARREAKERYTSIRALMRGDKATNRLYEAQRRWWQTPADRYAEIGVKNFGRF